MSEELINQLKQLGVILLTKWQTWYAKGRDENKFHCDLLLAPGAFVVVIAEGESGPPLIQQIQHIGKWAKVHIDLSWELRDEPFEN